jgi:FkbM family methyltransferase
MRFEKAPSYFDAAKILHQIAVRPTNDAARKIDKPLAIYGAGKLGKMAIEFFDRIGIRPDMILDANPNVAVSDPYWNNRNIVSPDVVPLSIRATYMLIVSIATLPFEDLATTLGSQGWTDIVPFYDVTEAYKNIYPLSNGWVLQNLDDADIAATQEVLNIWGDDISRAHHIQFLAWHRFREDWTFAEAPVNLDNRYFIPEVMNVLGCQESFLDVGAHQGEISERFLMKMQNSFKDIWMIEPDHNNYEKINRWLTYRDVEEREHMHLLPLAVSDNVGQHLFYSGIGYASQLSTLGQKKINVTTIDQLNLDPTFIKIHLEGSELEALKGAIETIIRCKPILAVTSYHNHLGVWQLPMWLINQTRAMGVPYQFFMRLHSWCGTGAVVYGIPNERSQRKVYE